MYNGEVVLEYSPDGDGDIGGADAKPSSNPGRHTFVKEVAPGRPLIDDPLYRYGRYRSTIPVILGLPDLDEKMRAAPHSSGPRRSLSKLKHASKQLCSCEPFQCTAKDDMNNR